MPRRPRLFVSGGFYHVYCRTHRGEFRFSDSVEKDAFIDSVAEVTRTHRLQILAWCLMTNHYHLVVKTADVKLWRSMARIHGRVTRQHNAHNKVFGSGWQSRYRARIIQENNDLRHVVAYVHLNPVTAGLTKDPAKYGPSGHRALIGQANPILIDIHAALRCYGGASWMQAGQRYLEYVRCVAEAKWLHNSLRTLPWWQSVKDDHQTVAEEDAPPEARTFNDKYPDLPFPFEESVEELLVRAAPLLGNNVGEIAGRQKSPAVALARRRFTIIASRHFNHSLKAIGEAVGKHSSQVSRWLNWETEAYYADPQEACIVDEIAARLVREQP